MEHQDVVDGLTLGADAESPCILGMGLIYRWIDVDHWGCQVMCGLWICFVHRRTNSFYRIHFFFACVPLSFVSTVWYYLLSFRYLYTRYTHARMHAHILIDSGARLVWHMFFCPGCEYVERYVPFFYSMSMYFAALWIQTQNRQKIFMSHLVSQWMLICIHPENV